MNPILREELAKQFLAEQEEQAQRVRHKGLARRQLDKHAPQQANGPAMEVLLTELEANRMLKKTMEEHLDASYAGYLGRVEQGRPQEVDHLKAIYQAVTAPFEAAIQQCKGRITQLEGMLRGLSPHEKHETGDAA
jgi:hypothetical protein